MKKSSAMKSLFSTTQQSQLEISHLICENQELLAREASLLSKLALVRKQLSESNEQIHSTMEDLLTQLISDKRAQSQADFWEGLNKNDLVFRGLAKTMDNDQKLMTAVHAVAAGPATDAQKLAVLFALMTELSGQPASILPIIAKRAIQFNNKGKGPGRPIAGTDANTAVEIMDLDNGTDANQQESVYSSADSQVKIEGPPGFLTREGLAAAGNAGAGNGSERLPTTPGTLGQGIGGLAARAAAVTFSSGVPANQRSTSDLLQELCATPTPLPIARPGLGATSVGARSVNSPFNDGSNRVTKNAKPIKEVGEQHPTPLPRPFPQRKIENSKTNILILPHAAVHTAFVLLMKKLEVAHAQNALPLTELLRCSKCDQVKRDARVLNCLHIYCHRCTQRLRVDAEVGSAEHGFKSFCVKQNCSQVVAGKTAVLDAEVMELLVWYDKQSPGLTTSAAQLHVLKSVLKKKPTHNLAAAMLDELQKRMKVRERTGENDEVCNLLEVAKLAKKLCVNS